MKSKFQDSKAISGEISISAGLLCAGVQGPVGEPIKYFKNGAFQREIKCTGAQFSAWETPFDVVCQPAFETQEWLVMRMF